MKTTFEQYANWKKIDTIAQCILFVLMLASLFFIFFFGFYIIAAGQCISSIIWLSQKHAPQKKNKIYLRYAIISITAVLLLLLILDMEIFAAASIVMLFIGPVLGISYFVTTVKEQRYFANARKMYYQL